MIGKRACITVWGVLLWGFQVCAETNYWVAVSGTGQWHEASNWSLNAVPGEGDTAVITNAASSGNGYTVEVDQAPARVWRLTCGAPAGQTLTLNVRTNLAMLNNSSSDSDWSFGPKGNVTIHVFSNALFEAVCQILGAGASNNYHIARGGTLTFGTTVSKRFRAYGGLHVQGSVLGGPRAGELVYVGPSFGGPLLLDGGYLRANQVTCDPVFTNSPVLDMGAYTLAGTTVSLNGGTVTNRANQWANGKLGIGGPASANASAYLNLAGGGIWMQQGPTYVCERPRGYLTVSGNALFWSTNHVWVGSNNSGTQVYLPGYHGYLTVEGGTFAVTNQTDSASLFLGNITDGYLTAAGGTSVVDRIILSNPADALGVDAVGSVTVSGGVLTARHAFLATNGLFSPIAFLSGTLNLGHAEVANTRPFLAGNGTDPAVLGLLSGAHRFADGIVVTNHAVLSAGGVGSRASAEVTGDLTLAEGAALHCDFQDNAGDSLSLAGKLTLPAQAAVTLTSLDGSLPQQVVLVAAETLDGTLDLSGWTVAPIGEIGYRATVEGSSLVLVKKPKGTLIGVL
ncbi:MAG: hypothetical protein RBT78_04970 [Kiritimatiellia bacterium]|jgi:hypothetical protein|nr:hypothetical protein [Kiritimatiellia bacterium]